MAHSEKVLDITALGKCEVNFTKSQYSFKFALLLPIQTKPMVVTQVLKSRF